MKQILTFFNRCKSSLRDWCKAHTDLGSVFQCNMALQRLLFNDLFWQFRLCAHKQNQVSISFYSSFSFHYNIISLEGPICSNLLLELGDAILGGGTVYKMYPCLCVAIKKSKDLNRCNSSHLQIWWKNWKFSVPSRKKGVPWKLSIVPKNTWWSILSLFKVFC